MADVPLLVGIEPWPETPKPGRALVIYRTINAIQRTTGRTPHELLAEQRALQVGHRPPSSMPDALDAARRCTHGLTDRDEWYAHRLIYQHGPNPEAVLVLDHSYLEDAPRRQLNEELARWIRSCCARENARDD